jgi:hypothetical protein
MEYDDDEQIKNNVNDRTCSEHGGDMYTHFWLRSMKERDHSKDIGVDGCTI